MALPDAPRGARARLPRRGWPDALPAAAHRGGRLRLLLDGRLRSGVGTVVRSVVPHLAPTLDEVVLLGDPAVLGPVAHGHANVRIVPFSARVHTLAEQWRFPLALARETDLLHVPHYNIPLGWRGPLVATINDLAHLSDVFPTGPVARAYARFFIRRVLRRADAVLTLSAFSQGEIARTFGVPAEDIIVGGCGVDTARFTPDADPADAAVVRTWLPDGAPYVLVVGSVRPHKNVNTALRAFGRLKERFGVPHKLLVVGEREGFLTGTSLVALPPALQQEVRFTGFAADALLPALFRRAAAFVQPSLYEGFGLPPLEAMACGTPVVCSDRASLPEVVGDAALLVPALDADAMADALHAVLTDAARRAALVRRGHARVRHWSWAAVAACYRRTYEVALARRRA
ncbi:MAG: glycosyltransferase family 1 protein [Gemmatimonadales bacterium]|nr:glycosyltransferase family 1 protein [Gemmatimonadales bacterium]